MKIKMFYILLLVFLSGCSSIYHPKESYVPEGFVEKEVSHNEYEIFFEAYQKESWEELERYLFKRAGEIGEANNFSVYSFSKVNRKEKLESITVPAVVVPESVGSCGSNCTYNRSGMVIPEYQIEFHIRAVSSTFTYDMEIEGKQLFQISGEPYNK
jgi:hypothetical protein